MEREAGIAQLREDSSVRFAEADEGEIQRVAVIGVHGIARHPAGETQNAMADLLLSVPSEDGGCDRLYEPFKSVGIQIPLCPVNIHPMGEQTSRSRRKQDPFHFEELSAKFARYLIDNKKAPGTLQGRKAAGETGLDDVGNDYTQLLLGGYQGGADGNAYITARLEGARRGSIRARGIDEQSVHAKVDIYEVLWADLAHPASNIVGFFLSLFSLVLHLGSLSRIAIDSGAAESPGKVAQAYRWTQRMAVLMLQIYLPLFKVLALCTVLAAIPGVADVFFKPENYHNAELLAVSLGVLSGVGVTLLLYYLKNTIRWWLPRNPWLWSVSLLFPGVVGTLVAVALLFAFDKEPQVAASILCWICVGGPILAFILSQYGKIRAGVWGPGIVGFLAAFVIYLVFLGCYKWQASSISQASFWLLELLVGAIRVSWLLMCGLAIAACLLGAIAWRQHPINTPERARMRAAARTSRFALAMASVFFMLVTAAIWGALFKAAELVKPSLPCFPPRQFFTVASTANSGNLLLHGLTVGHLIPDLGTVVADGADYFRSALAWGLGPQFPVTLALVVLGLLILIWFAAPSALLEGYTQRGEQKPPRYSSNFQTQQLGSWLSRGLDATEVVTTLFWCSIFLAFPLAWALSFLYDDVIKLLEKITLFFCQPGGVFGVAVVGALFKYGSSILETILDVDTYLRDTPENATPRAKIFERFVSTLRYVASYRDEKDRGYDKVVIVAHSLGSLISADILRFLKRQQSSSAYDPQLAPYNFAGDCNGKPIEIRLLTMGAPKRQLLNRFFPYLYEWVRPNPDHGLEPLPMPLQASPKPVIAKDATPQPSQLGVALWVNAYRSGDYVGRSIWLDEWYRRTTGPDQQGHWSLPIHKADDAGLGRAPTRVEMCIGAGAHTRYWDDTAPDVAEVLNWMI